MPIAWSMPGVSGDTTAGGLRRVDWALRLKPAIVIVELGANDALRGQDLGGVRANLDAIVERFQAAGARVLVAGMRVPPNYGERYGAGFERLFAEVAAKRKAALMPFFLDGVAADARLNQADGIHPTAEGTGSSRTASGPTCAPARSQAERASNAPGCFVARSRIPCERFRRRGRLPIRSIIPEEAA